LESLSTSKSVDVPTTKATTLVATPKATCLYDLLQLDS
jgi:hypothetical protein